MLVRPYYHPVAHSYYHEGLELRSVTALIKQAGKVSGLEWYTDAGRERGHCVHALTAAVDCWGQWPGPGHVIPWPRFLPAPPDCLVVPCEGSVTLIECPEEFAGYVDGYWSWRRLFKPRWAAIEVPVGRIEMDEDGEPFIYVAGTPDRIGVLLRRPVVVDVKCGDPLAWHGLQTAAYDWLSPLPENVARDRYGLYLKPDGKFRLLPHDSLTDLPEFLELAEAGCLAA